MCDAGPTQPRVGSGDSSRTCHAGTRRDADCRVRSLPRALPPPNRTRREGERRGKRCALQALATRRGALMRRPTAAAARRSAHVADGQRVPGCCEEWSRASEPERRAPGVLTCADGRGAAAAAKAGLPDAGDEAARHWGATAVSSCPAASAVGDAEAGGAAASVRAWLRTSVGQAGLRRVPGGTGLEQVAGASLGSVRSWGGGSGVGRGTCAGGSGAAVAAAAPEGGRGSSVLEPSRAGGLDGCEGSPRSGSLGSMPHGAPGCEPVAGAEWSPGDEDEDRPCRGAPLSAAAALVQPCKQHGCSAAPPDAGFVQGVLGSPARVRAARARAADLAAQLEAILAVRRCGGAWACPGGGSGGREGRARPACAQQPRVPAAGNAGRAGVGSKRRLC